MDDNDLVTAREMAAKKVELEKLWNEMNLRSELVASNQHESAEETACSNSSSDEEEEIIIDDKLKQKINIEEVD